MGPWFGLLLAVSRPTVEIVAIVRDPTIAAHDQTSEAIATRVPGRPVFVSVGQTAWDFDREPTVVVAIGDIAEREAAQRWPERPRAALLVWSQGSDATYRVSARLDPVCSSERLHAHSPEPWIVLASPDDAAADELAAAVGGQAWHGTALQLQHRLKASIGSTPVRLWMRSDPTLAIAAWLTYLGRMSHLPGVELASDSPGLLRFGIANLVEPDLERIAHDTADWITRQLRSRRAIKASSLAPCKAGSP